MAPPVRQTGLISQRVLGCRPRAIVQRRTASRRSRTSPQRLTPGIRIGPVVSAATDLHRPRRSGAKGAVLAIAALVLWVLTASAGVSLLSSGRAARGAAAGAAPRTDSSAGATQPPGTAGGPAQRAGAVGGPAQTAG